LFFNIPARKKFLRKPKLEENDITNYVSRLILANPNISIKYSADNKIIYQSFGSGLYDAIYSIYGKSIVDNIFEVNFGKGNFKFNGYLGKPTFSKPNRTYQTLIINGRYVINQTISTSIFKAYENFIMKGTFPFFVLNLTIPLDKVDVNVHPNKLEVKFEDSNSVFGLVYSEIADILYSVNNTKKVVSNDLSYVDSSKLNELSKDEGSEYSKNFSIQNNNDNDEIKEVNLSSGLEYEVNRTEQELEEFKKKVEDSDKIYPYFNSSSFNFKVAQNKNNLIEDYESEHIDNLESHQTNNSNNTIQTTFVTDNNFRIVGTLFDTYILVEKDNNLLLIDQHAGHERLLFDKFSLELDKKQVAVQPLMLPFILETNYTEATFINDNLTLLSQMGFEIEEFGSNSFKISSTPLLFDNINLDMFFDEILSDIDNKLILSKNNTLRDYLAKKACKSAVKGNMSLTQNEIDTLLKMLNTLNQVLLCPHGRPIIVEVSKKDIEKWFKRIV
ncbi:MAG: DNA mismatch repair endonuclease MutL, partial [Christensenellales bacterium]